MNGLTEIEQRYAYNRIGESNPLPGYDPTDPFFWPMIRCHMKIIAYHEAGHYVAKLFTQLESSTVMTISIMESGERIGCVRYEGAYAEASLQHYEPSLQCSNGRMLLLETFAGVGAEIILEESEEWESILEYWEFCDDNERGTDYLKALRIAVIMAKRYMPISRILKLADKWTMEMLRMPAVWTAVETVANILLTEGIIEKDELKNLQRSLEVPWAFKIPNWKRRLYLDPPQSGMDICTA